MDRKPKPGELYRHFKNELYQVIAIAVHTETNERLVIYQAMYGSFGIYARPLAQFVSEVDHVKYPHVSQKYRFEKVEPQRDEQEASLEIASFAQKGRTKDGNDEAQASNGKQQTEPYDEENDTGSLEVGSLAIEKPEFVHGLRRSGMRPRTQSPAESKRVQRQVEAAEEDSDDFRRRRRQMEEREQRRELFRKQERHESATEELRANPNLLKFLDTETYEEKYRVLNEIQNDITDRLIDDIAVVLDVVIPEGPLGDRFYQLKNIVLTRQKYEINRFRR